MTSPHVDDKVDGRGLATLSGSQGTGFDAALRLDPRFVAAYAVLASVPEGHGSLHPKVRELIGVAINSSVTHLQLDILRAHVKSALAHGATKEEIMEVYELTSVLGVHTLTVGVPVLLDVAKEAGQETELSPLSPEQQALKADFVQNRGYWTELWETVLQLSPEYFAAYANYSSVPWKDGPLEPKVKELIYIAITASTTHLFEPGARVHMHNAIQQGATVKEILEVLELVSLVGIQTVSLGAPVLEDEVATAKSA